MTRTDLHAEAERIAAALVLRFGPRLPADAQTTLSYFVSCRHGVDRAAQHVLALKSLLKEAP
jgi:hypothetical protein